MPKYVFAMVAVGSLAACGGGQGVGLGPVGYGGQAGLPQSARAEVTMQGLTPLPLYRFEGEASAAKAATIGGSDLRRSDKNTAVEVGGNTYEMRHIEISGAHFVVAMGPSPVSELPTDIKARTGCLVDPTPISASGATVYTLDCS